MQFLRCCKEDWSHWVARKILARLRHASIWMAYRSRYGITFILFFQKIKLDLILVLLSCLLPMKQTQTFQDKTHHNFLLNAHVSEFWHQT
jgi:hypothetical protein